MERHRVEIVDDLTGELLDGRNHRTIRVALDEEVYRIDGSPKTIRALREALAPFIANADRLDEKPAKASPPRRKSGGKARGSKRTRAQEKERNRACREWAAEQGIEVAPRGLISRDVMAQFLEANPSWK